MSTSTPHDINIKTLAGLPAFLDESPAAAFEHLIDEQRKCQELCKQLETIKKLPRVDMKAIRFYNEHTSKALQSLSRLSVLKNEPKWFVKFSGPSIVRTIAVLLHREGGASRAEILAILKDTYPSHEEKSLASHINSELSSLQKRLKKKISKKKDVVRGIVYSFK